MNVEPHRIRRSAAKLPLSSSTLGVGSLAVMGLGLYFVLLRPSLLPEDLRYLDRSLEQIEVAAPALTAWLRHVFWVVGGYMFATGVLTLYVALTTFRARARGAAVAVTVAGAASAGSMAVVNFLIASDFKWPLLALALLWVLAITLYVFEASPRAPLCPHSRTTKRPMKESFNVERFRAKPESPSVPCGEPQRAPRPRRTHLCPPG